MTFPVLLLKMASCKPMYANHTQNSRERAKLMLRYQPDPHWYKYSICPVKPKASRTLPEPTSVPDFLQGVHERK